MCREFCLAKGCITQGEVRDSYCLKTFGLKTLKGRGLGDQDLGGMTILKLVLKKCDGRFWTQFIWRMARLCEYCDEHVGFITGDGFLDYT